MREVRDKAALQPTQGETSPPRRIPTCDDLLQAQNSELSSKCAKKVNVLSCRCSGCETDGTNPVITGPSDAPLLNTAYDGSGGFLTSGNDAHWEAGLGNSSGPASVSSWIPAFVVVNSTLVNPTGGAWTNSPFGNAS